MISLRKFTILALTGLVFLAQLARADDTEIFTAPPPLTGSPPAANVLIIIDNSANWDSSAQAWPDNGGKQGAAEIAALQNLVSTLVGQNLNVGLMFFTAATGSNPLGGYMRFALRLMNSTNASAFQSVLSGVNISSDKVGTSKTDYSGAMFEAFKYYGGYSSPANVAAAAGGNPAAGSPTDATDFGPISFSGPFDPNRDFSGNTVLPPSVQTSGNAFSSSTSNTYVSPITDPCQKNYIIFIGNGYPSIDSSPPLPALNVVGGDPTAIGNIDALAPKPNNADEWARFLFNTDVSPLNGQQNVKTYTIDVYNAKQDLNETALLKSMATVGHGRYFAATNQSAIQVALTNIFNEIQSVSSVFASVTLPVSVNVRGTNLNQVYLGVFRPDANSAPRWFGNLKEYQLALDTNGNLFLADAESTPIPVESTVTGFVVDNAISFWTTSSNYWTFNPSGNPPSASDSPDGAVVEKGATAEVLRNIYANSQSTRPLITCINCGTTTTALSSTAGAATSFDNSNTLISQNLLVLGTVLLQNLTGAGTTATAVAPSHGFSNGGSITVAGATPSAFNGTFIITVIDPNTFTYTLASAQSGTTAIATTATAHGFANSASIAIAGATPTAYNGSFTITVTGPTTFTYTLASAQTTNATGTITATPTATTPVSISSVSGTNTQTSRSVSAGTGTYSFTVTATVTSTATLSSGQQVVIAGVSPTSSVGLPVGSNPFSGSFSINVLSGTQFSYSGSYTTSNCTGTGSNMVCTPATPSASSATATPVSTPVTVSSIVPGVTATGTITATGSQPAARTNLINWVRGQDVLDENLDGATTEARPSIHGEVLHSRPAVVNYNRNNDNDDVVVFYGANDGIFHAVKGGQKIAASSTTSVPGDFTTSGYEKWGFIPQEFFGQFNRMMNNSPAITRPGVPSVITFTGTTAAGSPVITGLTSTQTSQLTTGMVVSGTGIPVNSLVISVQAGTGVTISQNAATSGSASLTFTSQPKPYFADGPIGVFVCDKSTVIPTPTDLLQKCRNGDGILTAADGDIVQIFIAMRRGGRFIYALDVTNPESPTYLWKHGCFGATCDAGYQELGQTWSQPTAAKLNINGTTTEVLIFGGGYDPTVEDQDPIPATGVNSTDTMGRGIFVVNATTGDVIWQAGPVLPTTLSTGETFLTVPTMTFSIPSDMSVIDRDRDGIIDRAYVGDTGGNVWRADFTDPSPANWKVNKLASLGYAASQTNADRRKFLFPPSVVPGRDSSGPFDAVLLGSGDREHPFNGYGDANHPLSAAATNRFYMLKDRSVSATLPFDPTKQCPAVNTTTSASFVITDPGAATTGTAALPTFDDLTSTNLTVNAIPGALDSACGWFITFGQGEKNVSSAVTVAGTTFFNTNQPTPPAPGVCTTNLGIAREYAVNYLNAGAVINNTGGTTLTLADRFSVHAGGGYLPSPVPLVVNLAPPGSSTPAKPVEGVCVGTECKKAPGGIFGARIRTYWYKEIE